VRSEREYKRAIEYLHHHPQERERLGRNAREYARRIFGAENAAKQLNPIYEKMMQDPKRRRLWGGRSALDGSGESPEILEKSAKPSGAQIFSESVADAKPCFGQSMTAQDLRALLAAEREIALSPPVLRSAGGGGILHYRKHYPNDGFLRLWSGLVLHLGGQYVEAASEYVAAIKLGCKHWRLAWYLAQLAEQAEDFDSAQKALQIVLQAAPDFAEAQEMAQRLAQLTGGIFGDIASSTNMDGSIKMPARVSLDSKILPGFVAEASELLLNG
jgi:tetratricopeptide (TPR) repeat protein